MKKIFVSLLISLGLLIVMILSINIFGKRNFEVSYNKVGYKNVIVLDPGHGGKDEGTSSANKVLEKDLSLEISLKLKDELIKNNFKVYLTRDSDKLLGNSIRSDIINRATFINLKNPDAFVSIHLNGLEDENIKGVETYTRYLDNKSYALGESIQNELSSIEYTKDRGVKTTKDRNLGILRGTISPGVLLELGFLTNSEDEKYLVSNVGQDTIIKAILNGILNYFEENDLRGLNEEN